MIVCPDILGVSLETLLDVLVEIPAGECLGAFINLRSVHDDCICAWGGLSMTTGLNTRSQNLESKRPMFQKHLSRMTQAGGHFFNLATQVPDAKPQAALPVGQGQSRRVMILQNRRAEYGDVRASGMSTC